MLLSNKVLFESRFLALFLMVGFAVSRILRSVRCFNLKWSEKVFRLSSFYCL